MNNQSRRNAPAPTLVLDSERAASERVCAECGHFLSLRSVDDGSCTGVTGPDGSGGFALCGHKCSKSEPRHESLNPASYEDYPDEELREVRKLTFDEVVAMVDCPWPRCRQPKGTKCLSQDGTVQLAAPHKSRIAMARQFAVWDRKADKIIAAEAGQPKEGMLSCWKCGVLTSNRCPEDGVIAPCGVPECEQHPHIPCDTHPKTTAPPEPAASDSPAQPELLPCPFCGSLNNTIQYESWGPLKVRCTTCGGLGPDKLDRTASIEAWNTRSTSAPTEAAAAPSRDEQETANQIHLGRLIPNEVIGEYEQKVLRYAIVPDSTPFWRRLLRWAVKFRSLARL